MRSTQDCKTFLAGMVAQHPEIVTTLYGGDKMDPAGKAALLACATTPKQWSRLYKCRPGGGNHMFYTYWLYPDNIQAIVGRALGPARPASAFVWERGFILAPDTYDTGVCFAVLEDAEGKLFLGDYIGD